MQLMETELLVAGGGMAGVCCALAAARLGTKVILCQDRPVLGGNASSEVRMHVVGATGLKGGVALETELREGGIMEEIRLDLAVHNPQRSPAMMDLLLFDKCKREANLTLLLNTVIDGAEVEGGSVKAVHATRASTEERFRIVASTFVDCTGDGRLGLEAGAMFRMGREGRAEFSERLAPEAADKKTLGSTLLFQARRHARPMPFVAPPWVRTFSEKDFTLRPFARAGSDLGLEYGYWWAEWGGCLDTIKDNERIRDELLAITLGVWNYIKNHSGLDVRQWALEWVGFLPGKRESRRFVGRHILTESDLFESRPFSDAIAFGGWPIDTHPPEGVDAPHLPPCEQHHLPYLYDIPLRSCLANDLENLMFAGRNISATHIAFASTRVMATCAAVGQGVGTAAALALREHKALGSAVSDSGFLDRLQQQLLRDDCYLIGRRNHDPEDLVRTAVAITASSAQSHSGAEQIRSGQTRSIHGKPSVRTARLGHNLWEDELKASALLTGSDKSDAANLKSLPDSEVTCAPPDRSHPGIHRWMSEPAAGLPAWIEIRWSQPVRLSEIVLVFDTGMHRHLTLSQADGYTATMKWGQAQPETVRSYYVEGEEASGWKRLLSEENNYQRRRRHHLPSEDSVHALRITVTATHGIDHARLFEVRAYGAS